MDRAALVAAVRAHALKNYNTDGWDFLVECWEDEDILAEIGDADTEETAIAACHETVSLLAERRDEVRSEAW